MRKTLFAYNSLGNVQSCVYPVFELMFELKTETTYGIMCMIFYAFKLESDNFILNV